MQCLQLTRGDPPAASMQWYFNQTIILPEKGTEWKINFTLSGATTKYNKLSVILQTDEGLTLYGHYTVSIGGTNQGFEASKELYTTKSGWVSSKYRTITFATPPTGDLLTWLKANATPQ